MNILKKHSATLIRVEVDGEIYLIQRQFNFKTREITSKSLHVGSGYLVWDTVTGKFDIVTYISAVTGTRYLYNSVPFECNY